MCVEFIMAEQGEDYFDADLFINKEYTVRNYKYGTFSIDISCLDSSSTDFDLTGQILWPAADVLAYYISTHSEMFQSKKVLELGAGVGLCALMVAKYCGATHVTLTDHNEVVMDIIRKNIDLNAPYQGCIVDESTLDWKDADLSDLVPESYDLIIGSDILFWPNSVAPLVETVERFLSKNAEARFVVAFRPRNMLVQNLFLDSAKSKRWVIQEEDISQWMPDPPREAVILYEIRRPVS